MSKKLLRRAAIMRERYRRYYRYQPLSLSICLLRHLAWVQGHRQLYLSGKEPLDIAFCWQTLHWASECNRRIKAGH